MKRIWPFSFYFLYFAAFASLLPFLVLFYQQLGFSGAQIGLLTGVPPLITLAGAPFLTRLADATQKHKLIMGVGLTGALIVALILPLLQSFILVFLLVIAFNIFMSSLTPLADSAIMTMLGAERSMYGRVRLGGTIGWGLFAPIAGWMIDTYGLKTGFWAFAAIMLINLYVSQRFTFGKPHEGESNNGGIRTLLTNRNWILFLLTAFLGGLGSMSAAAYLFPYMAELGASETMMGIAITISTLTELPIFFFGHHLVKRFTSRGLLLSALLLLGIRSLLYALVNSTPLV
ncbi:MAG TPA: MFS transporter, partial [Anaerolineales bacterium]|nr:MFS transporter [Anaerolineales bacterium]